LKGSIEEQILKITTRKYCSDFKDKIRQVSLGPGNPYLGGDSKGVMACIQEGI
jgi:hypothetical protein